MARICRNDMDTNTETDTKPDTPAKLREIRIGAKLSQREFGALLGVDQAYVSRLERGLYTLSADHIRTLAQKLGVDPRVLLGLEEGS